VIARTVSASLSAVAAAFGSALCCGGPFIAAFVGTSAAGLSSFMLPYRPLFILAAVGALWMGYNVLEKEEAKACEIGAPCADPKVRRRMKYTLWVATGVAVFFGLNPLINRIFF